MLTPSPVDAQPVPSITVIVSTIACSAVRSIRIFSGTLATDSLSLVFFGRIQAGKFVFERRVVIVPISIDLLIDRTGDFSIDIDFFEPDFSPQLSSSFADVMLAVGRGIWLVLSNLRSSKSRKFSRQINKNSFSVG